MGTRRRYFRDTDFTDSFLIIRVYPRTSAINFSNRRPYSM